MTLTLDFALPEVRRPCRECGAPVIKKPGPGRWPVYCSDECRDAEPTQRRVAREAKRSARSPDERALCRAGDHSLCSPEKVQHGVCSECGKTVRVGPGSAAPDRRRCRECRGARPGPHRDLTPRVCDLCGESYVPKPAHRPGQRWCSKSCAQAWRNGARPPYDKRAVTGMARKTELRRIRSQRRAETWDGVTDEQIFERDHWRCGICGKRISAALKYPHPRSKSIDHVVPLAEGGGDTAANKRAAHLLCNTKRRHLGGNEQLALIG